MRYRIHMLCLLILCAFCICIVPAWAEDSAAPADVFPEGVVVVPAGTQIIIDDEAQTVTVTDCPAEIHAGDTFVVYLQELPIGYVATAVTTQGEDTVIRVVRADNAIYANLEGDYNIELTPDMYEFIPAEGITVIERGLGYSDGKLTMNASGGGVSMQAYLSGLSLSNSAHDGSISVTLSGNWGFSTTVTATGGEFADVTLGKIRVMGVGYFDIKASLACSIAGGVNIHGSFGVGFTVDQNGHASITKRFQASGSSFKNQGTLTASLSVSAGVDVLVAMADVHVEIGAVTEMSTETYDECCSCTDYCIFLYSNVGAVAKYFNFDKMQMVPIEGKGFEPLDINWKPFEVRAHFCDGEWVTRCHHGNHVPGKESMGGISYSFGSTLLDGNRERITEDEIYLPWDMVIDGDYTLAHGSLNLNGHHLTVNGDLIQTGGILNIGGGTLTVNGDYRIQGELSLQNQVIQYADSTATLIMKDAADTVTVAGDFILQSTSDNHQVTNGVFNLRGGIYQHETASGAGVFKSGQSCNFVLTSPNAHVLSFEDAANNHIGWLTFHNHVSAPRNLNIGRVDMNGYNLTVAGNLTTTGQIHLQDFNPDPPIYTPSGDLSLSGDTSVESGVLHRGLNLSGYSLTVNGDMRCTSDINLNCGTLTIKGTLYHESGEIYVNGGKLIITGHYYLSGAGSNFTPGNQVYKTTTGRLVMKHAADEVRIGGNFLTVSHYSSKSYTFLTDGTMYIGGDFRHAFGDKYGFNATGNHKVVFNGSAPQTIQFDAHESGFAHIEFVNPNIVLTGNYLRGFTLQNDINLTLATNTLYLQSTMDCNGYSINLAPIEGDFMLEPESWGRCYLVMNGNDITINGNFTSYCDIDLSGQTLTVNGNFFNYDPIHLNGGTLNVAGDVHQNDYEFYVDNGKANIAGSFLLGASADSWNRGVIDMRDPEGELHISGNFVTVSDDWWHNNFRAGTMYIGGNFRQMVSDAEGNDNFNATGTHKVVFNGTGTQSIEFESNISGFNIVEFVNPNIELKGTQLRGFTLQDDLNLKLSTDTLYLSGKMNLNGHSLGLNEIDGDFTLAGNGALDLSGLSIDVCGDLTLSADLDLSGQNLAVHGDMFASGGINLHGGTLSVEGSLFQQGGTIYISSGKLIVDGSYCIAGSESSFLPGAESYDPVQARLEMTRPEDVVRIGGDFVVASSLGNMLTNGVMYISGDVRQVASTASIQASESHRVVLNGSGPQSVLFEQLKCRFGTLELTCPRTNYTFAPDPCWIKLIEPSSAPTETPAPDPTTTPAPVRRAGDTNEDGVVDIFDALETLKYAVGWEVTINVANADVNRDGEIDIFDALLILQYSVGWEVELQ